MKGPVIRISILTILSAIVIAFVFVFNIHTSSNATNFLEIKTQLNEKVDTKRYEFDESRTQEQLTIIQGDVKKILEKMP